MGGTPNSASSWLPWGCTGISPWGKGRGDDCQINGEDFSEELASESRLKVAKQCGKGRFYPGENGVYVSRVRKWKIQGYASSMMQERRGT